ncbi:hypothetical protein [Klebsiella oxytoca]|uniref:hypothetical protein n=5 Tax=Klebsiella TaxID=570 RepID=UPI0015E90919|nr:hypothetical protein [Klebsiella oxytoca]EKX5092918.1 hypothetical protein [Klebsiella oxytoca]ELQ8987009.1 hypothetical protein [Klebsiella oxytoca]QLU05161.1 hypothetical protein HV256_14910 [Klebsiella oxytoca]
MPFYLTRDPVPSADMRNVFDNAQNLDLFLNDITSAFWTDRLGRSRMSWFGMESAFTVKLTDFESHFATQLTAQETEFDAAQADKEARFVHFLDSSGYVFLGDYEDGPFQFSARNQYIRFQGQFFRLSKETDTGFTTTGTDETSFANDVTHLVLMDGDTLRQNLGSDEEGMGTWLSTHVQDGVVTQNLHDFLNSSINFVTPQMFSSFQEAATFASENKVKLHIGPYQYDINEPIEVWGSLCIEGDGEDFSKLIQKAGATGDAVIIQHLQDVNDTFQFSGFSVETEKRFSVKNTAIIVDGTALIPSPGGQIPRRTKGRGIFRNLRVCGTAENRSENIGFGVHFDLRSLGWYDMESINVTGCAELGTEYKLLGIGLLQRGGGWPVEINQSRLRFYNLEYAWYCPDYVEGLFLDKYQFVNVRNGIVGGVHDDVWSLDPAGKLGMYQPFIGPGHINASDVAIYINNVSYGTVTDVFAMMNDKGVATSVNAAHLRGGIRNSVHNLNILHYSTNTGLSRKSLILNNISDSFISNMNSETKSDEYEKHDVAIQFVSSSFRNRVDGLKVARANTAVLNGEGCGNNVINGYRADGVATPVMDNAGDMVRGNTEGRNVVFSPAGAAEYVITVTPRQYLSRRPLGVSCDVIRPTTVPMNIFYDRDSSSPSAIVLKVRPITTSALPTIECEISLIIHD